MFTEMINREQQPVVYVFVVNEIGVITVHICLSTQIERPTSTKMSFFFQKSKSAKLNINASVVSVKKQNCSFQFSCNRGRDTDSFTVP